MSRWISLTMPRAELVHLLDLVAFARDISSGAALPKNIRAVDRRIHDRLTLALHGKDRRAHNRRVAKPDCAAGDSAAERTG